MAAGSVCHAGVVEVPRYLVVLAVGAFLLKIVIALSSYGSTDVLIFEADLAKIRQEGAAALYRDGVRTRWCGEAGQRACPPFIHPPFMIYALQAWGTVSRISGLPLRFWLRFTCAAADVGSLVLVIRMLQNRLRDPQTRVALALFAASPIMILLSGFHGNTDAIMIFLVLVSVWLLESRRPAWLAGAVLGMAASIKILPVLLAPTALLSLPGTRRRVAFGAGAVAVFVAGSLPVLAEAPDLVITRVFGYSSQSGPWGVSFLAVASLQSPQVAWLYDAHTRYGKLVSLVVVLGATVWPRPRSCPNALFMRVGLVMSLFLSLTPGFGVQYLAWLVPWLVALGHRATGVYYLVGSAFLFAYYTAAGGRFPWYLANSLERAAWTPSVISLGLICWAVICCIVLIYVRSLRAIRADRS